MLNDRNAPLSISVIKQIPRTEIPEIHCFA
jgi:hypothetical protein